MFALENPGTDARRFVSSRRELAAVLGCHERTVANMLIEPGNPGTRTNGTYEVEPWRTFFKNRKDDKDAFGNAADLKAEHRESIVRERKARAEKAELEAAVLRGELVKVSEVEELVAEFSSRVRGVHHRAATVDAVNELATILELDTPQVAALLTYMEKFHARFCNAVCDAENATENGKRL